MRKILFFAFALFFQTAFAEIDKDAVYVVANASDAQSVELAEFYCSLRNIKPDNIILLDLPKNRPFLSRAEYVRLLENPLFEKLVAKGAVSATPIGSADAFGRCDYLLSRVNLDFLVLCRGIPWGISTRNPSSRAINSAATEEASVDSEISARFIPHKMKNSVRNPVYKRDAETWRAYGLVRTARLDGATLADVKNALLKTLEAERRGLRGRAYIDKSLRARLGDIWLEKAAEHLRAEGFDVDVESTRALFPLTRRFDYPAYYFGWHSSWLQGYFALPEFRVSDGMVGWQIYSFSALSMRSRAFWTPMFVSKNAGATDGNVFEPFLALTRDISEFSRLYFGAKMLPAEAAFAALPALSWQSVYVGDPLYNPHKKTLEMQIADIDAGKIDELSQYALIRRANIVARENGNGAAAEFLGKYAGKIPDTALVWKMLELSPDSEKGRFAETLFSRDIFADIQYSGLAFELSRYFEKNGDAPKALHILEAIVGIRKGALQQSAAKEAERAAKAAGLQLSEKTVAVLNEIAAQKMRQLEREQKRRAQNEQKKRAQKQAK